MQTLKTLRTRAGLSQHDLAVLIGVTAPAVHLLEVGKRRGRPETWRKIAAILEAVPAEAAQRMP